MLRKLFYKKPPDGLLEICEHVYVFDCCFSTNVWKEDNYKVYMKRTITGLIDYHPDSSFLVFNFCQDEAHSKMGELLSVYDMTIMDYPCQYEGCPLLSMEMLHHFLRSSESWLSLGQQNLLLMHCEWGGWPVLAFMLTALLLYTNHYSGEKKTLDMIYKQAPRMLLKLLSPLNPMPSQLRYLQYVSRRNVASEWPPADRALNLDCIILTRIPNIDGKGGCRPIFRIYGQDPFLVADKTPKVLYSTPKKSSSVRYYMENVSGLVKFDINCHVQGDVVVECISLCNDMVREDMIFRVVFNTSFIRSNILMLNSDEIDIMWDAKRLFPKEFRAEIIFSEMDAASSTISLDFPTFEEKEGLPMEAFAKVHEFFNNVDWLDYQTDVAFDMLQQMDATHILQEKFDSDWNSNVIVNSHQLGSNSENLKEETRLTLTPSTPESPSTMGTKILYALSKKSSLDSDTSIETNSQDSHVELFNQSNIMSQQNNHSTIESLLHDSTSSASQVSHLSALSEAIVNHSLAASQKPTAVNNKIISTAPKLPLSPVIQPTSISSATKAPPQPTAMVRPFSSISESKESSPAIDTRAQSQDKDHSALAKDALGHKALYPTVTSKTSSSTFSLVAPPPLTAPPLKDNQIISGVPPEVSRATPSPPKEPLSVNEIATVRKDCFTVPQPPPTSAPAPVRIRSHVTPPPPMQEENSASRSAPPPPPPMLKENSAYRSAPPPPPPLPMLKENSAPPLPPPFHLSQVANPTATSSAPPPPPPPISSMCSAPSPPPPPISSMCSAPSPPPSKAAGKCGSPAPPPPPLSSTSAPRSKLWSHTIDAMTDQKKLKPLHWLKLSRAVQGSLWAEAQKLGEASKAPEIDMSELENLFSAAAPNKTNQRAKSSSRALNPPKSDKVLLVELRRASNCEIMLSKVKMPLPELINSVLSLNESALDIDQVDNLIKFCPTKEEVEALKGYTGDKEKLGKCEQFFMEVMRVPRAESKLRVFSFKIEFRSQVSDLKKNLNVVNSATKEIKDSVKFTRVMQTILQLGNALNQGTARGSAVGFKLDSLLKLTDTRARNNKITLMHYLCKVLADKLPDLLDFSNEIPSLELAAKVQLKHLAEEMQFINKGLEKVMQELSSSGNDGPVSQKFCETLKEFLSFGEAEVRSLTSLYSGVGRNVDALIVYFGEDPSRCPFEQVTTTLLNFVRMFNKAHVENSKKLEQEIKKST